MEIGTGSYGRHKDLESTKNSQIFHSLTHINPSKITGLEERKERKRLLPVRVYVV